MLGILASTVRYYDREGLLMCERIERINVLNGHYHKYGMNRLSFIDDMSDIYSLWNCSGEKIQTDYNDARKL